MTEIDPGLQIPLAFLSFTCQRTGAASKPANEATPGRHSHAYRVLKGHKAFGCCAGVDTQCAANRSMKAEGLTHGVFEERQVKHGVEIACVTGTECSTQSCLRSGGTRKGIKCPCERRRGRFVSRSEKSCDLGKNLGVREGLGSRDGGVGTD